MLNFIRLKLFIMKKLIYSIAFGLMFLCSCEPEVIINKIPKDKECIAEPAPFYLPGDMIYGRVAGLKNCLPFLASAQAIVGHENNTLISLDITTYIESGNTIIRKEILGMGVNCGGAIGEWPLYLDTIPQLSKQGYTTFSNQNQIEDNFILDKNYEYNRLYLENFDNKKDSITGWFECRFIMSSTIPSGINPDTILFTECHFIAIDPH